MAKRTDQQAPFDDQLVLFRYFLHQLRLVSLAALSRRLNHTECEGLSESGGTRFCELIAQGCADRGAEVPPEKLRTYDENICRHTRQIGARRGGLRWKYFQYLALLFTEMYLDRLFSDPEDFCAQLNQWLREKERESLGLIRFQPYTPERMNKLAFMCATGSGKTLIMHVNILQFLHYFQQARRINGNLAINRIILLAPNEGMGRQHLEELALSSIPAAAFEKDGSMAGLRRESVLVIDMNKLKEEGRVKTVSVDSFERNNLVLVDEGHRGLSGDAWYDYRTRLFAEGFAFEYSATFKQALCAGGSNDSRALMEEYGKSIIMDYSYKYFYSDGYGKDYRIYNMQRSTGPDQRHRYLVGCLLTFYQQMKLFQEREGELRPFCLEKPLLVFVGNRVTAPVRGDRLTQAEKELLTDVEEVLVFLHTFLSRRRESVGHIRALLMEDAGLVDGRNRELFSRHFQALEEFFGRDMDPEAVFADMLRLIFNTEGNADEPRLSLWNIRQVPGEIGLRVGRDGEYFGVINIGDTAGLLKNCQRRGLVTETEEFVSRSMFQSINGPRSRINVLVGSRKFTEGWNSWRVSTMGLINFAKGEGAQAIQLFGRGVRLKGYRGSLKRSRKLDLGVTPPKHMELLETLTIFGVKAQYMEDFKSYLQQEGAPLNDKVQAFRLPVISRLPALEGKRLYVIRVKDGADFRRQGRRLLLDTPDQGFLRYLCKNKTVIDCRGRVQTIDSSFSFKIESTPNEEVLPPDLLPLLDLERIFAELQRYKSEKEYYHVTVTADWLLPILQTEGWYSLLIPMSHLKADSIAKLEAAADYAVMALKAYLDKFVKYEKDRWETQRLEYASLGPEDSNFIDEYLLTYAPLQGHDPFADQLGEFLSGISASLEENGTLEERRPLPQGRLTVYDFPGHLYAPLISLEKSGLDLQAFPTALNRDELRFVEHLDDYVKNHGQELEGKSLYLLRNKSKAGMGFFEADNFHPDFILWIDTEDRQYLSFIDPRDWCMSRRMTPRSGFIGSSRTWRRGLRPRRRRRSSSTPSSSPAPPPAASRPAGALTRPSGRRGTCSCWTIRSASRP